jgi:hypothetical protein
MRYPTLRQNGKQAADVCPTCNTKGGGDYYDRRDFCANCEQAKQASSLYKFADFTADLREARQVTDTSGDLQYLRPLGRL